MAGELFHLSMTFRGWNRPDAGFLAALAAGTVTGILIVAFLARRLRAGAGRPGPSRTARWGALVGTLVAAWLMALAWLEGGVWLTPQLALWLWPPARLLAPVPTWIVAPAVSASWLAVAMAANGLVYALLATVAHLVVAAVRGRVAARAGRGAPAHRLH